MTNPYLADAEPTKHETGLIGRFSHLFRELGKFGVVGGIAYVVDFALYNLLLSVTWWLPATVVSTVIAASLAFIGNRYWTWRDRERSGLAREYGLYFVFNAIGLLIAIAVVWLSHDVLGGMWPAVFQTRLADNVAKMLVGTGLGTLFRFWAYRRFVFAGPATSAAPATRPAEEITG